MTGLARRTLLALCVVALVGCVGVGVAASLDIGPSASTPTPEIIESTDSTDYLVPDQSNVTRREYVQADSDLATVVAVDGAKMQGRHDELVFDRARTDMAPANANSVIYGDLIERINSLQTRQEQVFDEYSRGDISSKTLVRELSRLEVLAQSNQANIEQFAQADSPLGSYSVYPSMLSNPVSDQLVAAQFETQQPLGVYLVAAPDSLAASTVVEDTYYRQSTLLGEWDTQGEDQFAQGDSSRAQAAGNRFEELYSNQVDSVRGFSATNTYQATVNHSHGELFTYLDGSTQNPVHEYQYKRPVIEVPASTTFDSGESFRLTVQYTDPTGPMAVTILGTGTEVPPTVDVTVDGNTVGTISQSGQLWTIQPTGSFTVRAATDDGDTVSVTVTPSD